MRTFASRRTVALIVASGLTAFLVTTGPPVIAAAGDGLAPAVGARLRAWHAGRVVGERLVVEPKRLSRDGRWAFGAGVDDLLAAGAEPVGALFLAHREGGRWRVAVEGGGGFAALARVAPRTVVHPDERGLFAARATESSTGLALPWAPGRAWGGGQVHGDAGASRPFNAIDFYGGDGKVRASAGGRLYRACTGSAWPMLIVVHDNGWATGYYHTRDQTTVPDGSIVAAGQYLGTIGVELPCGGETTGPHVHWTLWRNGNPVAVDGQTIGGWTFHEGSAPYGGWAEHAGVRVNAWDCCHLVNYGPS